MTLRLTPAWTTAGWTMLHTVWIGAVVGLVLALLRRLLRCAAPEIRHGVAVAGLLVLTAVPALLFSWLYHPDPAIPVAIPGRDAGNGVRATEPTTIPTALEPPRPDVGSIPIAPSAPLSARFEPLVSYLPGVWLSGSLATLVVLATGLAGVERWRRTSRPLESDAIAGRCRALARSIGIARRVGVAVCDRLAAPILIGIVRPMILLPPAAVSGWSIDQVEMALLHELAHIRRHDNLVTLLQRLTEALLFFHPAAWWLSAWITLERELCCDRLVVEHTGRPHAYARMLAGLAGVAVGPRSMAIAMAERPLTTRIRRILDMEDRSMKVTLTEGLGLLAAVVAGTAMAMAAHARPPESVPAEAARRTLETVVRRIMALPDDFGNDRRAGEIDDGKGIALVGVAEDQLRLGDRAAALATLRLLDGLAEPPAPKPGTKAGTASWTRFAALVESVDIRRRAGDLDGARAALDRAAHQLEILDRGAVRGAIERVGQEIDAELAKNDQGTHRLNDEEAAFIAEASAALIAQSIDLGDMARARALIRRALASIGPARGTMKTLMIAGLGGFLIKAGDPAGGRELIEQARRSALAMSEPATKGLILRVVARVLAENGDLDPALALVREAPARSRQAILRVILEGLATDDHTHGRVDLSLSGLHIMIGDPWLSPRDPARARVALPKVAAAIRALDDVKVQARTLAVVAQLQSRAGDAPGGLATARSIPDLKRSDFPGPSDGFYDAVKPVAFALIAGLQFKAGDATAAAATLGEAEALADAVTAEDQKLVALIAIAREAADCQRRDAAKATLARAIPIVLAQPEPRRSRMLSALAESQAQAGDPAAALRTIDAIREYPGLEKARVLRILVQWYERAHDDATAETLARRALAGLESKPPETPLPGKVMTTNGFARDTFVDYDLELRPMSASFQRAAMRNHFRIVLGDVEGAVRGARALPPPGRGAALSQIVGDLIRRGDAARAMDLAASIESPDARMRALVMLASAIAHPPAKK